MIEQWVVYDHPKDFPTSFVARKWTIQKGGITGTQEIILCDDLDALRRTLRNLDLVQVPRSPSDDPVILEIWI